MKSILFRKNLYKPNATKPSLLDGNVNCSTCLLYGESVKKDDKTAKDDKKKNRNLF